MNFDCVNESSCKPCALFKNQLRWLSNCWSTITRPLSIGIDLKIVATIVVLVALLVYKSTRVDLTKASSFFSSSSYSVYIFKYHRLSLCALDIEQQVDLLWDIIHVHWLPKPVLFVGRTNFAYVCVAIVWIIFPIWLLDWLVQNTLWWQSSQIYRINLSGMQSSYIVLESFVWRIFSVWFPPPLHPFIGKLVLSVYIPLQLLLLFDLFCLNRSQNKLL